MRTGRPAHWGLRAKTEIPLGSCAAGEEKLEAGVLMQIDCADDWKGCLRMGRLLYSSPYAKAFNEEWSILLAG